MYWCVLARHNGKLLDDLAAKAQLACQHVPLTRATVRSGRVAERGVPAGRGVPLPRGRVSLCSHMWPAEERGIMVPLLPSLVDQYLPLPSRSPSPNFLR